MVAINNRARSMAGNGKDAWCDGSVHAHHDAVGCYNHCSVVRILACDFAQGMASRNIHTRMVGMRFHGVKYALKGVVRKGLKLGLWCGGMW